MIELPILGLLKEKPLHGYDLKRRLETLVGYFDKVSYGSLYPMLRKLEVRRYVTESQEELVGKKRITYQITPAGEQYFLKLMRESDAPFTLKMLFFKSIPTSNRKRLLQQQLDEWSRKLEERKRAREKISQRSGDRYRAALLARSIDQLQRDIAWLKGLR